MKGLQRLIVRSQKSHTFHVFSQDWVLKQLTIFMVLVKDFKFLQMFSVYNSLFWPLGAWCSPECRQSPSEDGDRNVQMSCSMVIILTLSFCVLFWVWMFLTLFQALSCRKENIIINQYTFLLYTLKHNQNFSPENTSNCLTHAGTCFIISHHEYLSRVKSQYVALPCAKPNDWSI